MYRDLSFENAIDFARDLVRIPSTSGDEGAVAERVMSELKLLRFDDTWTRSAMFLRASKAQETGLPSC